MTSYFRKILSIFIITAFVSNTVLPTYAQSAFVLPVPGEMVRLSAAYAPPLLKAVKVNPDNPFAFNFIVDTGSSQIMGDELQKESNKLIRYFLASLTTPENDLWVNLSPYEKDRVVPNSFGVTEMGRDLLAQDYLLKQITATLMYPEEELGKKFWDKVYQRAYEKFGTTNIMANTFNKVWIVPEKAVVYENGMTAFVSETKLKVMLEEDYKAMENNRANSAAPVVPDVNNIGSQVVREIIIPELEKEVNSGKNFASLRQVYNSLILANWYKKRLQESILAKVYVDKNKVAGVDIDDKAEAQKIYEQYIAAFKKGVYNYIKEDVDPVSKEPIPRKYFSGGMGFATSSSLTEVRQGMPPEAGRASSTLVEIDAKFDLSNKGTQKAAFTGGEIRSSSSVLASLKNGLAALALGASLTFAPPISAAEVSQEYRNQLKRAQTLVDQGDFSEAQRTLGAVSRGIRAQIAMKRIAGDGSDNATQVLIALRNDVQNLGREAGYLSREEMRKLSGDAAADAIQEGEKPIEEIVRFYEDSMKQLIGQFSQVASFIENKNFSEAQRALQAIKPDWAKAYGRLRGMLNVKNAGKSTGDYRTGEVLRKNFDDLGKEIRDIEQYFELNNAFLDLGTVNRNDAAKIEQLQELRREAVAAADDVLTTKGARGYFNNLAKTIDNVLSPRVTFEQMIEDYDISIRKLAAQLSAIDKAIKDGKLADAQRSLNSLKSDLSVAVLRFEAYVNDNTRVRQYLVNLRDFNVEINKREDSLHKEADKLLMPGLKKGSSAVLKKDAMILKINYPALSVKIIDATSKVDGQVRDEALLRNKVKEIGDAMQLFAHGVSLDEADPFRRFANIVLEGQLNGNLGALSAQFSSFVQGEYLAVMDNTNYNVYRSIAPPDNDSDFMSFLFPSGAERDLAFSIVETAVEQGLITSQRADRILPKLQTYQDFIDRYEDVLSEKGSEAPVVWKELDTQIKPIIFTPELVGEPRFNLSAMEQRFARFAAGEIAVMLAKKYFYTKASVFPLIAEDAFTARMIASGFDSDGLNGMLEAVSAKIIASFSDRELAKKYRNEVAEVFAQYFYQNYHLPQVRDDKVDPSVDLSEMAPLGLGKDPAELKVVGESLAVVGAGLEGLTAISRYFDAPLVLVEKDPFILEVFKKYAVLTIRENVQIINSDAAVEGLSANRAVFNLKTSNPGDNPEILLQKAAALILPGGELKIIAELDPRDETIPVFKNSLTQKLRSAGFTRFSDDSFVGREGSYSLLLSAARPSNKNQTASASVIEPVGGIDLSGGADKANLEIRGEGAPLEFNFDPTQLQNLEFDGLVPVIINIAPVINLPLFLSENTSPQTQDQLSRRN